MTKSESLMNKFAKPSDLRANQEHSPDRLRCLRFQPISHTAHLVDENIFASLCEVYLPAKEVRPEQQSMPSVSTYRGGGEVRPGGKSEHVLLVIRNESWKAQDP